MNPTPTQTPPVKQVPSFSARDYLRDYHPNKHNQPSPSYEN